MESHSFLVQFVAILLAARVFGEIAAYCKVPSVLGELAAGLIIGPTLLGYVEMSEPIQVLAQIGVILLLFEVGLETDLEKLSRAGLQACTVAVAGVVFPLFLGLLVGYYYFNYSFLVSLFIGATLTATSIGITLRVFQDLKKQNSHASQVVIGAAIVDDIIGIVLLAMLYEFSVESRVNLISTVKLLFSITLFFVLSPLAVNLIGRIIRKWNERSEIPGLLTTMTVSLILFFAWIAKSIGAPELLGGFTAGLAFSKGLFSSGSEEFRHKVEEKMQPIVHLFVPFFFVSIGLSLDLNTIDWKSATILQGTVVIACVAIIGKIISGFFFKDNKFDKFIIGIAMIPRGEVGLVFANMGLSLGIFYKELYATMILVITITTLIAPFMLRWLYMQKKEQEKI